MTDLVWKTEQRKPDDLIPFAGNPRRMTEEQVKTLTDSLVSFGLVEIPAIDTDGTIIAGHQRVSALQLLGRGQEEIDVRVPNRKLTNEEYETYNLGSNRIHAGWNYELLKEIPPELLEQSGFTGAEVARLLAPDMPLILPGLDGTPTEWQTITVYYEAAVMNELTRVLQTWPGEKASDKLLAAAKTL